MADLGNIGRRAGDRARFASLAFADRAQSAINASGATAGALVVVMLRAACVAVARADVSGDWTVPGLNDGAYWAVEVGTLRAWLIEVAGATVTVTPQTGGGGGGDTIVAGYAWASIG